MNLFKKLENLTPELQKALDQASSLHILEELRVAFLGRKGRIAQIMAKIPELSATEKPKVGQLANIIKNQLTKHIEEHKNILEKQSELQLLHAFDAGLPGKLPWCGSLHPITKTLEQICSIFTTLGYTIVTGPEIETEYYNFEALNLPADHPARDMQDTFYLNKSIVLRTHTSPIQIRTMLKKQPPLAIIAPGCVYRRDSDNTHTPMFHQVEGLFVNKNVSMVNLRGTLTAFLQSMFGADIKTRFRPSFFPFTEPSAEMDISCTYCNNTKHKKNTTCRICKGSGWLEVLGCGMVHPEVFKAVHYDSDIYTGFAFGIGVERIAMLKYCIEDIRIFFENDIRLLKQFT